MTFNPFRRCYQRDSSVTALVLVFLAVGLLVDVILKALGVGL